MSRKKEPCRNQPPERFVLMTKESAVPFWLLVCTYKSQLRGGKLPDHDCLRDEGGAIIAWCEDHKGEFNLDGGVYYVHFKIWFESPEFRAAIETTLKIVLPRNSQFLVRLTTGASWLTALCCVGRAMGVEIEGGETVMTAIWRLVHQNWAGPGCANSDLYAGCVELLRPFQLNEPPPFKIILTERAKQLEAGIVQLGKRQDEVVNAHKRALELQGVKSKEARDELACLIDSTANQQAELDRETKAFKERFAAQLYQVEQRLTRFETEIAELRDAVKALEKRFDEQEKKMAMFQTKLDAHTTQLDAHTVDIKKLLKELAATQKTVKELEAAAETTMALLKKGSTQRKALEDRLEQQTKKLATACAVVKHVNEKVNAANKIAAAFKKQRAVNAANKIAAAFKKQRARRAAHAAAVLHSPQPRATASSSGTPSWLTAAQAQVFQRPPLGDRTNDLPRATDATPCAVEATPEASPAASPNASPEASPQATNNAPAADDAPALDAPEPGAPGAPDAPAAGAMVTMTTTTTAIVLAVSVLVGMAINYYPSLFLDFLLAVFHFLKDFFLAVFHFLEEM